jgi:hypothetical protein
VRRGIGLTLILASLAVAGCGGGTSKSAGASLPEFRDAASRVCRSYLIELSRLRSPKGRRGQARYVRGAWAIGRRSLREIRAVTLPLRHSTMAREAIGLDARELRVIYRTVTTLEQRHPSARRLSSLDAQLTALQDRARALWVELGVAQCAAWEGAPAGSPA